MCGRLNQFAKIPALAIAGRALAVERRKPDAREDKRAAVSVLNNICPTDYADVITLAEGGTAVERMRFGLVPGWARGGKAVVEKKFAHTFNARCETVFELASYRRPILSQRCLVPVRGWHEWPDRTTPYYIHRDDEAPLLLAAIWDVWESGDPEDDVSGSRITSMSVVTTPPGRYLGKFHDRSPLIFDDEKVLAWLDPKTSREILGHLMKPYESAHLEAWRVSTAANQSRNKSGEVLLPIAPPVPQAGEDPVPGIENERDESSDLRLF